MTAASLESETSYPRGFEALDRVYQDHSPTPDEIARYGSFKIIDTELLSTPRGVINLGEVLTNPSQVERTLTIVNGVSTEQDFAYFRQEPTSVHLGKTRSVPYFITRDKQGLPGLVEFTDAKTLIGEDPRIARNIRLRGALGTIYTGWCVSTVVATPKPSNPAEVESIKQVFYWGETLGTLEPVVEVKNLKNTCLYPVGATDDDTSIDVFGRPHPHISYDRFDDLRDLTEERVRSGMIITEDFLPPGVHTGVNFVKGRAGHPNHRELDIHEARTLPTPDGAELHYRLGRYGYELPSREFPKGRLTPLGVLATRGQFPEAVPKPPENGVASYQDVLYGSMGKLGYMVTGVSDRYVGIATIARTA